MQFTPTDAVSLHKESAEGFSPAKGHGLLESCAG